MFYEYFEVDKTAKQVIETEEPLSLERLQKLVGGYIEFVRQSDGSTLCINEEGLIDQLPRNWKYPALVGSIVRGKMQGAEFVGFKNVLLG